MNNYTTNKPLTQGFNKPSFIHTHFTECKPKSRCHNYKKCKTCHTIYYNKSKEALLNHLDEQSIREYKFKEYLVFTSLNTNPCHDYKNQDLEDFINELIRTKRNKSSVLNNAQYVAIKEISRSLKLGLNPHYNFIRLANTKFTQNKAFKKLASKYNIKVKVFQIYKKNNSFLTSVKDIINYSLKHSKARQEIEREIDLTKGQRDIKKSPLFDKEKFLDLHKRLYKYIRDITRYYNAKRVQALKTYKNYNKSKPSTRVKMLRSLYKKLNAIQSARSYYTSLARQGLKNGEIITYTHFIHTN